MLRSQAARLSLAMVALLLAFGLMVAQLSRSALAENADEALQRLSHGLAAHIVANWPLITDADPAPTKQRARADLLAMLSSVNPGIQVYVLDADGRVDAYIGEPGMVRQFQVDLVPVRAFLAGAALPLRGTDPMGSAQQRLFSAAMFPPRAGDVRPPGYLYIVLDGPARDGIARELGDTRLRSALLIGIAVALAATIVVALLLVRHLALPLRRLALRMQAYQSEATDAVATSGDEVAAIEQAFQAMIRRIEDQGAATAAANAAHRETLAGLAHDLRTPLTAMHGQLEALAGPALGDDAALRDRLIAAALGQSNRVRRLSQQLFELAALDASTELLRPDRVLLDELVMDAVQKLEGANPPGRVQLAGTPPGPVPVQGDVELIERALTNLIDNALRHGGATPVLVSLRRAGATAEILVEDGGPGLPAQLGRRLEQGEPVRDPALRRTSGGIGGLGLAIAQRIAVLHGGGLRPVPASGSGTRLCLALPLAA
jgi:signal transduction histidine kinase